MGDYSFLYAIAAALLAGAMSPGPSFLVVAQHSLSKSRVHGLATAIGTGLGAAVFALLAALGVTTLLESSPNFYLGFRLIGGLYLLYLAYKIWGAAKITLPLDDIGKASQSGLWMSLSKGFLIQISNPKTVFIIASIFSAIMPTSQVPASVVIVIALIAFVVDFGWYAVVAVALSNARCRQFYYDAKQYFDYLAAIILTTLGARLLYDVIYPLVS